MKRLYPLALAFIASVFCAGQANAQLIDEGYDVENSGIYYKVVDTEPVYQVYIVSKPDGSKYTPNKDYWYFEAPNDFTIYPGGDINKGTTHMVTGVDEGAFQGCDGIKYFIFSELVTYYGRDAFADCSILQYFNFPASVLSALTVEEGCFQNCVELASLSFGQNIQKVGSRAFAGCTSLKNITIQASEPPTTFAADAFGDLNLSSISVKVPGRALAAYRADEFWKQFNLSSIQEYDFEVDGIYYNTYDPYSKAAYVTYESDGCYSGDVVIPEKVTYNGKEYTIDKIGQYAFRNCGELTSVSIPETVTSFVEYAFYGCSKLKTINLPSGLTELPGHCFEGCTSLEKIEMPVNITNFHGSVFRHCTALKRMDFSECTRIYLYGGAMFEGCTSLEEVIFPETFDDIYNYKYVHYGVSLFKGCTSLTELTLPANTSYLSNEDLIMDCPNLRTLTVKAEQPPYIYDFANKSSIFPDYSVFTQANYDNVNLVVPKGSVDAYKAETLIYNGNEENNLWKNFKNISDYKQSGVEEMASEAIASDAPAVYYNLQGVRVENPAKGSIVICRQGDRVSKIIIK